MEGNGFRRISSHRITVSIIVRIIKILAVLQQYSILVEKKRGDFSTRLVMMRM